MSFREGVIDEIRHKIDFVALVSEHVALKRAGRQWVGPCPFHDDRTPSFSVAPDKGLFYCFGCQAGGDVFDYVMRREGFTFAEAAQELARRAGVVLEQESPEKQASSEHKARLLALMEAACAFYQEQLRAGDGGPARAYLAQRAISETSVEGFRLGWAPDGWDALCSTLSRQGYRSEELVAVGLASPRRSSVGVVDRFRGRLMFPIRDNAGRVVAFGGRLIAAGEGPKYLNSPEGPLFTKRLFWYDLSQARKALKEQKSAIIVEGYLDVVSLHQNGCRHALASLGTALTATQVATLAKLVGQCVLAYDMDAAGQRATERAIDLLRAAGLRVRVLRLDEGKDPDEFVRLQGAAAFAKALQNAQPYYAFWLDRCCPPGSDALDGAAKSQLLAVLRPRYAQIQSPVEQQDLLRLLSERLKVGEDLLRRELAHVGAAARHMVEKSWHNTRQTSDAHPERERLEQTLMELAVKFPELRQRVFAALPAERFGPRLAALALFLRDAPLDPSWPADLKVQVSALSLSPVAYDSAEQALRDCEGRLQRLRLQELQAEIQKKNEATPSIMREYRELLSKVKG